MIDTEFYNELTKFFPKTEKKFQDWIISYCDNNQINIRCYYVAWFLKLPPAFQIGLILEFLSEDLNEKLLREMILNFDEYTRASFKIMERRLSNDFLKEDIQQNTSSNADLPRIMNISTVKDLKKVIVDLPDDQMLFSQTLLPDNVVTYCQLQFCRKALGAKSNVSVVTIDSTLMKGSVTVVEPDGNKIIYTDQTAKEFTKALLGEWKICPKCNGNKQVPLNTDTSTNQPAFIPCDICNAKGVLAKPIIDTEKDNFGFIFRDEYFLVGDEVSVSDHVNGYMAHLKHIAGMVFLDNQNKPMVKLVIPSTHELIKSVWIIIPLDEWNKVIKVRKYYSHA